MYEEKCEELSAEISGSAPSSRNLKGPQQEQMTETTDLRDTAEDKAEDLMEKLSKSKRELEDSNKKMQALADELRKEQADKEERIREVLERDNAIKTVRLKAEQERESLEAQLQGFEVQVKRQEDTLSAQSKQLEDARLRIEELENALQETSTLRGELDKKAMQW